jgi:hypothetical protein
MATPTGKQLSALLSILRNANVTRFVSPDLTIEFSPPKAPRPPAATRPEPEPSTDDQQGEEDEDPRFLLEKLADANFRNGRAS